VRVESFNATNTTRLGNADVAYGNLTGWTGIHARGWICADEDSDCDAV